MPTDIKEFTVYYLCFIMFNKARLKLNCPTQILHHVSGLTVFILGQSAALNIVHCTCCTCMAVICVAMLSDRNNQIRVITWVDLLMSLPVRANSTAEDPHIQYNYISGQYCRTYC